MEMATKKSESEELKAQIKYLTDLINNAKNYGHIEHKKPQTKPITRSQLHSTKWTEQPVPVQISKRKDPVSFYQKKGSSFSPSATKSKYCFVSGASSQQYSQQVFNAAKPKNLVVVDLKKTVNHLPSHLVQSASVFQWESSKSQQEPSVSMLNKKSFQMQSSVLKRVPKKEDKNQDVPHITCDSSDKKQIITSSLQDNYFRTEGSKKTAVVRKTASHIDPTHKMTKSSFCSKDSHILKSTARPVSATSEKRVCSLKQRCVNSSSHKITEIKDTKAALDVKRQKASGTKAVLDTERQKITEITGTKSTLGTEKQNITEIAGTKAPLDTKRQKRTCIKAALDNESPKMSEITGSGAALDAKRQKMTADSIEHLSPLKESTSVISHTESSMKRNVDKLRQELLETEVRMITLKNLINEQKDKLAKMSSTKSQLTSSPSNSSNSIGAKPLFKKVELTENVLTNLHSVSNASQQTKLEKDKGFNSVQTKFKINNQDRAGTHGNIEKKVIKSRYSIRRISNNSESAVSDKKQTGSTLGTQYNLSRSYSKNPESLPAADTSSTSVKRLSIYDTSHTQFTAKTITSKYKLKKVLVERSKVSSPRFSHRSIDYHESKMKWTARKQRNSWSVCNKRKLTSQYTGAHKYYRGDKSFVTRAGQVYQGHYAVSRASSWQPSYILQSRQKQNYISIRNVASKVQYLKEHIPFNPRLRIDRRKQGRKEIPQTGVLSVSTNRMFNRSNSKKMRLRNQIIAKNVKSTCTKIFTINGVKFKMDTSGKSLQRIPQVKDAAKTSSVRPQRSPASRVDIGGVTYIQTKPGTLEIDNSFKARAFASQIAHKSLVTAMAANYKKNSTFKLTAKQYCKFYNRFGKCNRGEKCPYIHDPDKIVICTRFLRGTCKVTDCPFSHKISKEKMPVCSFFLRGICNRDDCPYQHVNVGKDAKLCQDFVNGYCPLREKCKKRHIFVCPHFSRSGSCPDGKQCKLVHRRPRKRTNSSLSGKEPTPRKKPHLSPEESSEKISKVMEGTSATDDDDVDLPFRERQLPSFISLGDTSIEELSFSTTPKKEDKPVPSVRIRPQF
ncbi:hypothetical protein CHS0354_034762 [Potamilus streckersoni]|uniref:Zinc finger CCCH domain-containing protein 3 n=1 Tax=Potamilus streckersoni TaxID=2493646 RepID=A0AAE0VIC0_9BIVA|nr:hypothetical protein CHS0354_034762 [Potamilus streckersoni]